LHNFLSNVSYRGFKLETNDKVTDCRGVNSASSIIFEANVLTGMESGGIDKALESIKNMAESVVRSQVVLSYQTKKFLSNAVVHPNLTSSPLLPPPRQIFHTFPFTTDATWINERQ
jgi:hypothetical protein